jgi:hypothetical protein
MWPQTQRIERKPTMLIKEDPGAMSNDLSVTTHVRATRRTTARERRFRARRKAFNTLSEVGCVRMPAGASGLRGQRAPCLTPQAKPARALNPVRGCTDRSASRRLNSARAGYRPLAGRQPSRSLRQDRAVLDADRLVARQVNYSARWLLLVVSGCSVWCTVHGGGDVGDRCKCSAADCDGARRRPGG